MGPNDELDKFDELVEDLYDMTGLNEVELDDLLLDCDMDYEDLEDIL